MRWFFSDRTTGRVVVAQWPNGPLWLWIVATVVQRVTGAEWLGWLSKTALMAWALLELTLGASPFRRVLGGAVTTAVVVSALASA